MTSNIFSHTNNRFFRFEYGQPRVGRGMRLEVEALDDDRTPPLVTISDSTVFYTTCYYPTSLDHYDQR